MMRLAVRKFLALGRDEDGAALVTTLAMFFFMFVTLAALFAFGKSIRERIRVQNACDAAAYSAAVVQADTLSRVAVMNRQMAWTYVQMTRRQLDYIVMNMLSRACTHYEHDRHQAEDFASSNCELHRTEGVGWYIGADGQLSTIGQMQVNGINLSIIPSIPGMGLLTQALGLGGAHLVRMGIEPMLIAAGGHSQIYNLRSGNPAVSASGNLAPLKTAIHCLQDVRFVVGGGRSSVVGEAIEQERNNSNRETLRSIQQMNLDLKDGHWLNGTEHILRGLWAQILVDRVTIAALNLTERSVVSAMPGRIDDVVRATLKANLPDQMVKDCRYRIIQEEHPLAFEVTGKDDETGALADSDQHYRGYFANLHNNHNDERLFLSWAGYDGEKRVCDILGGMSGRMAGGIDQWFVRGNGIRRTEGMPGLQRCYKHWDEFEGEAKHNPYVPSCWNKEHLHESPPGVSLYCEWQWWADKYFCMDWLPIPICFPLWSKGWPVGEDCGFDDAPDSDMFACISSMIDWITHISDIFGLMDSADNCTEEEDGKEISSFDSKKTSCPMEDYNDGCLSAWNILPNPMGAPRPPVFILPLNPWTFYSRIYADDKHLYNDAYVGECAKPLVLRQSYFGRNGTITVCVACKRENAWSRLVDTASGLYSIFNPHGEWIWAIASAKAGHRNPNEDLNPEDERQDGDRRYFIHFDKNDKYGNRGGKRIPWNLVEDDWDAVMVPVRSAASLAVTTQDAASLEPHKEPPSTWLPASVSVVDKAMKTDGWRDLEDDDASVDWDEAVKPPPGLGGGNLDWKELADVMYH